MTDCVFCKIIEGSIPSIKVYEDDSFLAFLDIKPINPGHTLVIPKIHTESILTIPDETIKNISVLIKRLSNAIQAATNAEGINIISNCGSAAGQDVFHTHIHIIPRHPNDGYEPRVGKDANKDELAELGKKIKQNL